MASLTSKLFPSARRRATKRFHAATWRVISAIVWAAPIGRAVACAGETPSSASSTAGPCHAGPWKARFI